MTQRVLVPIADGTEEMEAVIIIDVLRRAGAEVTVASVGELEVTASRGVKLIADLKIEACRDEVYDMIILPGGIPGAEHLRDSAVLTGLLTHQREAGRWYGAICAAPAVVLAHHRLLEPEKATCHPAFTELLPDTGRAHERVLVVGRCVTSQGAGTALEFALKIVELLFDRKVADSVADAILAALPQPKAVSDGRAGATRPSQGRKKG